MVTRGWGRIVNISSGAALGGLYRQAGYSASKSGLLGLTRNIALEHARHGITCNAVLPGLIGTPAVLGMPAEVLADAVALTPARRTGRPEEIAAMVAFLCSEDAAFVNGAEIPVDGGGRLSPAVLGSVREIRARQAAQRGESA
jgi:NAD(P)-dependent dehydrogenase (short-subunit alcohol dehydrogenase family)